MEVLSKNEAEYVNIISILKNGGIVILPFDTCYGLVCDPTNKEAVDKLIKYKSQRGDKPISISVSSKEMVKEYVELNETAKKFSQNFLPGPFTVISESKEGSKLVEGVVSRNNTVGWRIPGEEWLMSLILEYGKPITSTSANRSYQKTPYAVKDILDNATEESLKLIDLIVDAGKLPYNPPSTVVDTTSGSINMIRKGSIIPNNVYVNQQTSNSPEETIEFGLELMNRYKENLEHRPVVFALQGELGAGKTHMTKGIIKAFDTKDEVSSPTFVLVNEYKTAVNKVFHIDTWRLENVDEFKEIGFEDMFVKRDSQELHNVIVIEWAEKVLDYIKSLDLNYKMLWVEIDCDEREHDRVVKWSE